MDFSRYGISYEHQEGEFCTRTISPSYFISYFLTDYMVESGGALRRSERGDMFIARPGDIVYHGSCCGEGGFVNDWIYFDSESIGALLAELPLPIGVPFKTGGVNWLRVALEGIGKERAYMREGYLNMCEAILTEAVINIYRDYKLCGGESASIRLENTRGTVMKDIKRAWTLRDMAKLSGYSQSRFCALYKDRFGIPPLLDLSLRRIDEAKLLMLYGNMSISSVAEAVGYSSIYYFSRIFREYVGISPSEFKKGGMQKTNISVD